MTKRAIWRAAALSAAIALPGVVGIGAGSANAAQAAEPAHRAAPAVSDLGVPVKAATVVLRARHSGKCLTAAGVGDGSAVIQLACDGRLAQRWMVQRGVTEIRNAASGRCLDVWGNIDANGVAVTTWHCYGPPQQKWRLNAAGNRAFEIRSTATDRCLDVPNAGVFNGVPVQQWACHHGDNQMWVASRG